MWNKMDRDAIPEANDIGGYIKNPLWDELLDYMSQEYGTVPKFEYSRCAWPGWNAKFRKAGRSLCTIYPEEGFFNALIVIGKREKERFEAELLEYSLTTQDVYQNTQESMGQKWMLIAVEDEEAFDELKKLILLRRTS